MHQETTNIIYLKVGNYRGDDGLCRLQRAFPRKHINYASLTFRVRHYFEVVGVPNKLTNERSYPFTCDYFLKWKLEDPLA